MSAPAATVFDLVPPTAPAAGTRAARYHLIEAVRGLASLSVVLFHSLTAFPAETLTPPLAALRSITELGWLGVHVFFAVSGWCIAERAAQADARRESPGTFLRDRLLRIYPTYWIAVALTLAVRIAAAPFNSTSLADNLPAGTRGWAGTLLLIDPYVGAAPYLTVSWSLVYELGFYLCAAVALVALRFRPIGGRVIFGIGAALCLVPWFSAGRDAPWLVLGLWPNFFAGVAAWAAVRHRARISGCVVLLALGGAAFARPGAIDAGLLAAVGAALALIALHPLDERLSALRLVRVLLWLGTISYSLYLVHVPFLSAAENLGKRFVPPSSAGFVAIWLIALALALAMGWALAKFAELPLQRWRKRRPAMAAS